MTLHGPRWAALAALAALLALQACVVVPATRETYDADCKVMKRQMTLETAVVGNFQSCGGDACKAMLVAMGAVTAATAVVSGSVAMVGNMVYWFEHQGQCARPVRLSPSAAAAASAPN